MIKISTFAQSSFQKIEQDIHALDSLDKVIKYYDAFITAYGVLNEKFTFNEYMDVDYIRAQLAEKFQYHTKTFYGMPFGVKDVFNTMTLPTTMGSVVWKDFRAGNNARIVDEISDRAGIIFSKTKTAEFAVHYIQDGETKNPHNVNRITGTSSAGSAVAVACGALPICLGTQTAGSIVRPSSFCGVYGFKPSFGAFDRTGVLKTTDTLDTIGLIGTDIYGIRKTFLEVFQKDRNYPNSARYFSSYDEFKDKKKFRIGILTDQFEKYRFYDQEVKDDFATFVDSLNREMFNLEDVKDISFINTIHELHETIYCKSLSYYFQDEYARGSGVSELMSLMIENGKKIDTENFKKALNLQPLIRKQFDGIFENYDFILTPSTASIAPEIGNPERADTCLIWTFLGYPVVSLPIFHSNGHGMPFGLQIIAPKFSDLSLLDFSETVIQSFAG
jgi:Asp-tRNA(Asn)/Glu-tRNA(Gln) amidotransferase A subunit family amidase